LEISFDKKAVYNQLMSLAHATTPTGSKAK